MIISLNSKKCRFLLAGFLNTIAGYLVGLGVYLLIGSSVHILVVGIVANVIAITISFTSYKVFVFQTKQNWMSEYVKSYVAYGASAILGVILLWALIEGALIPFWAAQAVSIIVLAFFSYFANSRYIFRDADGRPNSRTGMN